MVGRGNLSFHNTAEDWFATSGTPFGDPAAAQVRPIELFTGWDSRFTALIAACDGSQVKATAINNSWRALLPAHGPAEGHARGASGSWRG